MFALNCLLLQFYLKCYVTNQVKVGDMATIQYNFFLLCKESKCAI